MRSKNDEKKSDASDEASKADTRTPLQRFRSFPRKPLTVTDLSSGAWCELQYWYTLSQLPSGKKTRTPAMKQGSKVHQELEDQVHVAVQVDVETKEDGFGLKLWNLVQGLRTLRDTGLTRELEVWGVVEDSLVNGIIDELSYENPDPEFEEEMLSSQGSGGSSQQKKQAGKGKDAASNDQKITSFFSSPKPHADAAPGSQSQAAESLSARLAPKVYLKDIKTRGSTTLPTGAALRPAKVQLFLYHRFLAGMAEGGLDLLRVLRRYGLDPDAPFSDSFLAQMGALHDEVFFDAASRFASTSSGGNPSSRWSSDSGALSPAKDGRKKKGDFPSDQTPDLIRYPTLRALLPLVRSELSLTFPLGAASLGTLLTVEYRSRADGSIVLGTYSFPADDDVLALYLKDNMEWWLGEREGARGVPVEEAYKCRICEFAEGCGWRREQEEQSFTAARERRERRERKT